MKLIDRLYENEQESDEDFDVKHRRLSRRVCLRILFFSFYFCHICTFSHVDIFRCMNTLVDFCYLLFLIIRNNERILIFILLGTNYSRSARI